MGRAGENQPPALRPRQAVKQMQDQGTWTAGLPHVLIALARPPRAAPRSHRHPAAPRPEHSPPGPERSSLEGRELPGRTPHSLTPRHEDRQAVRPQASGSWQRRRGPPTWPLIAASAARQPPFRSPRPGPVAPWRPPWRRSGGGGGGSAGSVVAGSAASRRLVVAPSLRVWRRRLLPARSSPPPRDPNLDP